MSTQEQNTPIIPQPSSLNSINMKAAEYSRDLSEGGQVYHAFKDGAEWGLKLGILQEKMEASNTFNIQDKLIEKLLLHATDRGRLRKIIRSMCIEFDKKQKTLKTA